jgi:hypothetical protein
MEITKLVGLFTVIPGTMLLVASFFVLFTISKTEKQGLRAFGYTVVTLLWVAAFLVLSVGVYSVFSSRHLKFCPMQEMMKGKMHGMMKGMEAPPMMREQTDNATIRH